jgi:hypothetical protein
MQRAVLKANSGPARASCKRYVDERGYLLRSPHWGALDGPDDAIETFYNWTLLPAQGGDDDLLTMFKQAQEGHLKQYGELRTRLTKLAEIGACYKEFITTSGWFHAGEGIRAFLLAGLSQPNDPLYRQRMKPFAGLYRNEDPAAPNSDPQHKLICATVYGWVGGPVPGVFHILCNPAGRKQVLNMAKYHGKMLSHCTECLNFAGDIHLNLAATILHLKTCMLTGEEKYRDWAIEYVSAWKQRAAATGGMIPSNIGLDGKLGGEHDGQ